MGIKEIQRRCPGQVPKMAVGFDSFSAGPSGDRARGIIVGPRGSDDVLGEDIYPAVEYWVGAIGMARR